MKGWKGVISNRDPAIRGDANIFSFPPSRFFIRRVHCLLLSSRVGSTPTDTGEKRVFADARSMNTGKCAGSYENWSANIEQRRQGDDVQAVFRLASIFAREGRPCINRFTPTERNNWNSGSAIVAFGATRISRNGSARKRLKAGDLGRPRIIPSRSLFHDVIFAGNSDFSPSSC